MGKVNVIIESDTTPTDELYETVKQMTPTDADYYREAYGIGDIRVYIVPVDEPPAERSISEGYYEAASAPFDYEKAAEFIVQNVPTVVPEYVGGQLAEATAPIDSERKEGAMKWIRSTAEAHGYQGV